MQSTRDSKGLTALTTAGAAINQLVILRSVLWWRPLVASLCTSSQYKPSPSHEPGWPTSPSITSANLKHCQGVLLSVFFSQLYPYRRMRYASLSCFGRSWHPKLMGLNLLVKSIQWRKNWYLSLASMVLSGVNIQPGPVEWGRPIIRDWNFACLINWCTNKEQSDLLFTALHDLDISFPVPFCCHCKRTLFQ